MKAAVVASQVTTLSFRPQRVGCQFFAEMAVAIGPFTPSRDVGDAVPIPTSPVPFGWMMMSVLVGEMIFLLLVLRSPPKRGVKSCWSRSNIARQTAAPVADDWQTNSLTGFVSDPEPERPRGKSWPIDRR